MGYGGCMGIEFEDTSYVPVTRAKSKESSSLSSLLISQGWAKDAAGAERIMLIVLGLSILAIVFFSFSSLRGAPDIPPPPPPNAPS